LIPGSWRVAVRLSLVGIGCGVALALSGCAEPAYMNGGYVGYGGAYYDDGYPGPYTGPYYGGYGPYNDVVVGGGYYGGHHFYGNSFGHGGGHRGGGFHASFRGGGGGGRGGGRR